MSLQIAQARAFDLAKTLMVAVALISIDGNYGVVEAAEFDGPAEAIIYMYDPWEVMRSPA